MNCGNNKKQGLLPVTGVASTYFHSRRTGSAQNYADGFHM